MKRYVRTTDCLLIDTHQLIPHLECYLKKEDHLYAEQINGQLIDLGRIIQESDSRTEVEGYDQSVFI